jgi:2-oxoglutarate dehydrogenase E1 component
MPGDPTTSAFNDGYIAEMFDQWRANPASVDTSWRQYFESAASLFGAAPDAAGAAGASPRGLGTATAADLARKAAGAANLASAIRAFGHLAVQIDPLGTKPLGAPELTPEFHGITEAELADVPGSALGFPHMATATQVIERLRLRYQTALAFEVMHLSEEEERAWFRATLTAQELTRPLSADEKRAILRRLVEVDGLERFLGRAFTGYKRFSIEGCDALVPMLDAAIAEAAQDGAREVGIAMAHRGRINVLAHILGKPRQVIFGEFEGRHPHTDDAATGDVKYHMGYDGTRDVPGAGTLKVWLLPNPSHLEIVNPVLSGAVRAHQRTGDTRDVSRVLPICIHGDAAFPGEGIVPESLNLSQLKGYRIGGTLHIIANNQVGFTTDPTDSRSTHYASDVAKGFEIPIIHVNADDAEACVIAVRVAIAYRARFKKDVLIDLVGYRRQGHNETDEPTFTQPALYARIKSHPTPPKVWAARLEREGVIPPGEAEKIEKEVFSTFEAELAAMKATPADAGHAVRHTPATGSFAVITSRPTAVDAGTLTRINEQLLRYPAGFTPHTRLAKQLERRREAIATQIDWGHAEALAFGSLLLDGKHVRLTGQDAERGTFSHRHAVLNDMETGQKFCPLGALDGATGRIEIHNSPLSELGVMGFEYGYAVHAPDTLTLWEAQFGDFANMAQPMMDQFLAADRAKWHQDSGLVLLLPHGYEGQGPEHSSARVERFLQLCADDNMTVAYPSSPAQYFHALRQQAHAGERRPLVLIQPKSLLRLPQAASAIEQLASGTFQPVIDDARAAKAPEAVRRLVFCTGKVFYDLTAKPVPETIAIVRVERLYPWPAAEIAAIVDRYPAIEEVAWVQEEPKNMGAWSYVWPRLRVAAGNAMELSYIGRPERASPAEGYASDHATEQARIVGEALEPRAAAAPKGRKGVAGKA